jgi:hypothetical protein
MATIVSAYFNIESKHSCDKYLDWIRLFLENVDGHIVFFCDPELTDTIRDFRKANPGKTHIVTMTREEFTANSHDWSKEKSKDPEADIHTTDLYKIWYEKKEFVKRAIDLNPFNHTYFVWTDAGIVRNIHTAQLIKNYPVVERIPPNQILLLNVEPFTQADSKIHPDKITGNFLTKNRIGGGIIAASKTMWLRWDALYNSTFQRYQQANRFVGKDQSLMATIVLENKDQIALISPSKFICEPWFYLLYHLGLTDQHLHYVEARRKVPHVQNAELYDRLSKIQ